MAETQTPSEATPTVEPAGGTLVRRHRLSTRLWHALNAVTLYVMFTSGLGIFNAHPRLYWGDYGANFDHAWLELSRFSGWLTLPAHYSLALSRRWHLAFALVLGFSLLAYMLWSLVNRHIVRDLAFRKGELRPAHVWQDVKSHARLRFPTGAAALRYNVLQKASYITVLFVLIPLAIATGLTLSPGMNAAWPWLLDIFGGRQTARSIHFIVAWSLAAFFIVHILMVLLAGPANELRSIVTGWYRLPKERREDGA
ncbi:MAG: cytochrome b/b6 domain-containing protein [Sphingobium sp.]